MSHGPLSIVDVSHWYGDVQALDEVSLEVDEGEFVTLLGPSGCGKTTLLRIIAGFIKPSAGRVVLQGRDITDVPPHQRPLNMVFQRPLLFPHLNVFDNVAFGLRIAGLPRRELGLRVNEMLELVRLPGMGGRRASELSGGQMQRVALARALVNRPSVVLLDEPLAALDLKVRLEMESELRRMRMETGATFIYVTHDQREALGLSDRIAVFSHGRIEQVDDPGVVYREPATPFAARFVGDANVLAGQVESVGEGVVTIQLGSARFESRYSGDVRGPAWLVLRPESVRVARGGEAILLPGVVRDVAFRGGGTTYRVEVPEIQGEVKAEIPQEAGPPTAIGDSINLTWDTDGCWLLPREGSEDVVGEFRLDSEATEDRDRELAEWDAHARGRA